MIYIDAAKILGLSGEVSPEIVRKAYKEACFKFHPDRNKAGEEMMKAVNEAYSVLKDFMGDLENKQISYGEELNTALGVVWGVVGLKMELCGAWLWVDGDTKPHKDRLKQVGFKWASKKKRWYFRPEGLRSRGRGKMSMEQIREKYGSASPEGNYQIKLTA